MLKRKYLRQGCGYPPSVNCTTWIARFGAVGSTFPCHYARTNQSLAITHLDTQVGCDWWRADHVTRHADGPAGPADVHLHPPRRLPHLRGRPLHDAH